MTSDSNQVTSNIVRDAAVEIVETGPSTVVDGEADPASVERERSRTVAGGELTPGQSAVGQVDEVLYRRCWNGTTLQDRLLRITNLLAAAASLIVLGPLGLLIAVAIKLDSRGPVLYRQVRVGRDRRRLTSEPSGGRRTANLCGRPFVIYKFRTMKHRAERESGPCWAENEDERSTRVGRFLRRFSLDEIPQLWNVLKGDMNLVGPRPERPGFVNSLRRRIPGYWLRQRVRPGITGLAQLQQGGDHSLEDVSRKVRRDLQYIRDRGVGLDLKILLLTPLAMIRYGEGNGAGGQALAGSTAGNDGTDDTEESSNGEGSGRDFRSIGVGRPESGIPSDRSPDSFGSEDPLLLVVTDREWLVPALVSVLDPAGIRVRGAKSAEEAKRTAAVEKPTMVMVDDALPDHDPAELCRDLAETRLPPEAPILLYSSRRFGGSSMHTRALRSGAWTVVCEPVDPDALVALIQRFLQVGELVSRSRSEDHMVDRETALLTLTGLRRVLPRLGALAVRKQAPLSFVVMAPSVQREEGMEREATLATAELCSVNVRSADVCAWVNHGELAIVAFDTPAEGARKLVDRLNDLAREFDLPLNGDSTLSAGVVELQPQDELQRALGRDRRRGQPGEISVEEFQDLYSLTEARSALRDAQREGGGVVVADVA